ncbi:MAG TPA: hypothetical protein VG871_15715 [Vicinamibacterales bacterium]|jgi:hypothetical protein|nr:hypothetical protein [Vicinamibacterales bacterium]HWB16000.1 hypothetical protein [Vicinamibacterales bacterium]
MPARVVTYQRAYDQDYTVNLCERHDPDGPAHEAIYDTFGAIGAASHGLHAGTCDMCTKEQIRAARLTQRQEVR